jgi:short-subunit dehydrogenase
MYADISIRLQMLIIRARKLMTLKTLKNNLKKDTNMTKKFLKNDLKKLQIFVLN